MKYVAVRDIDKECWEFKAEEIKKGTICEVADWEGCHTLMYRKKAVCDVDSKMCSEYFAPRCKM